MKRTFRIDCLPESALGCREGFAVVAIDVIRATTMAVAAASRGWECYSAGSLEAALRMARQFRNPLLAGEINGLKPHGFHMNNSPAELAGIHDVSRPLILLSSDQHAWRSATAFAWKFFSAPIPEDADVVISNAYPSDLSLTAVLQKGTGPLQYATAPASRIVIACCTDGVGEHVLFPVIKPRYLPAVQLVRRLSVIKPHEFVQAIARRLQRRSPSKRTETRNLIWLYRPLKKI